MVKQRQCEAEQVDGSRCQSMTFGGMAYCTEHTKFRVRPSGRYSKYVPKDVGERIQELTRDTADTKEEEALLRWQVQGYLEDYGKGTVSKEQFTTLIIVVLDALRKAFETRMRIELDRNNCFTGEEMRQIFMVLGGIIDKRVSDVEERKLAAYDFKMFLEGKMQRLQSRAEELPSGEVAVEIERTLEWRPPPTQEELFEEWGKSQRAKYKELTGVEYTDGKVG